MVIFVFLFWLVVVEVARKLLFFNEYGELETINTGDWLEAYGETVGKNLGTGG